MEKYVIDIVLGSQESNIEYLKKVQEKQGSYKF